jgi:hypothetical protein
MLEKKVAGFRSRLCDMYYSFIHLRGCEVTREIIIVGGDPPPVDSNKLFEGSESGAAQSPISNRPYNLNYSA